MHKITPTRDEALALLREYTTDPGLIRHALAVESVMRYRARMTDNDENTWGIVGLVHDLDYEKYPREHCTKTASILEERGWPDEIIRAVVSHGWGMFSDVEPLSDMEKFLYACDELTGLVAASALVRPSRSVLDMEVKSVKKKWKDKSFAAGVDRDVIEKGAVMLGLDINELINITILGMRESAELLGLKGEMIP
ncbi:MAG: hydrolase [Spirochaetae bacterium HGW-Spirochaetae-1]|jgi:predicted hydrolase (HD superfamily)|nr:MAG: hydrolase [Spirochaetae bacterium HGW-Spirochaetae-1]